MTEGTLGCGNIRLRQHKFRLRLKKYWAEQYWENITLTKHRVKLEATQGDTRVEGTAMPDYRLSELHCHQASSFSTENKAEETVHHRQAGDWFLTPWAPGQKECTLHRGEGTHTLQTMTCSPSNYEEEEEKVTA